MTEDYNEENIRLLALQQKAVEKQIEIEPEETTIKIQADNLLQMLDIIFKRIVSASKEPGDPA